MTRSRPRPRNRVEISGWDFGLNLVKGWLRNENRNAHLSVDWTGSPQVIRTRLTTPAAPWSVSAFGAFETLAPPRENAC
jgi:hypothetical protein